MWNQNTRVFTTDITIRVNIITYILIYIQCHRLLRHRPRGAPAQQAAKQQRHPFLHVFFLLLPRCPAARPVHDARCLIIPYPPPLIFKGRTPFLGPKRQFSFAILCLQPKHRGKALPLCPAKRNRPTAQRFDAISCRAGAQSPRRLNARASRSIPGSVTAAPPSAAPFPAGTGRGVSAVHLPSASVGPGDFLPIPAAFAALCRVICARAVVLFGAERARRKWHPPAQHLPPSLFARAEV